MGLGSGAWGGGVSWRLRPRGSQSSSQKRRRHDAPTGCPRAQKRAARTSSFPPAFRSQTPSLLAAPDLPRSLRRAPAPGSPKGEAACTAPSPRWGEGPAEVQRGPHPQPRARSGRGRPAPLPSGASRAGTPAPARRSPPSRRRRLKAAGRPARVAGVRGPPAALPARSEAIARRAGGEGRRRCAGPGRGRLYPRPQSQEAAPLPRRGRDSGGHVGGGGDARAGGLEGESQPPPALAPAAPRAPPATAHPSCQRALRGWTAPLAVTPGPGSGSCSRPRGARDWPGSPSIRSGTPVVPSLSRGGGPGSRRGAERAALGDSEEREGPGARLRLAA